VDITPQALDQRFTAPAAAGLKQVLDAALVRVVTAEPVAVPLLARFTAVCIQDRSTMVLPDALTALWQGCGGSTPERTRAALNLQVRLEMRTGRLDVQLQDGRASDQAAVLPGALPAGALRLADLGYWSLEALQALGQQGVCWLSRFQLQTALYYTTGCRRAVQECLEAAATDPVEQEGGWVWPSGCRRACSPCGSRRPWPMRAAAGCGRRRARKAARAVPRGWRGRPGLAW
jgi:hypothetical protein